MKLIFRDGWVLIRLSGTEPKIRVTAEGRTKERAQGLYYKGLRMVKETLEKRE